MSHFVCWDMISKCLGHFIDNVLELWLRFIHPMLSKLLLISFNYCLLNLKPSFLQWIVIITDWLQGLLIGQCIWWLLMNWAHLRLSSLGKSRTIDGFYEEVYHWLKEYLVDHQCHSLLIVELIDLSQNKRNV